MRLGRSSSGVGPSTCVPGRIGPRGPRPECPRPMRTISIIRSAGAVELFDEGRTIASPISASRCANPLTRSKIVGGLFGLPTMAPRSCTNSSSTSDLSREGNVRALANVRGSAGRPMALWIALATATLYDGGSLKELLVCLKNEELNLAWLNKRENRESPPNRERLFLLSPGR